MNPLTSLAGVSILLMSACSATAQNMDRPAPPYAQMAADLGVSEAALQACGPAGGPGEGARPTEAEHQELMTSLVSCLQESNPSLTADAVDQVMQNYRPAPPDRG